MSFCDRTKRFQGYPEIALICDCTMPQTSLHLLYLSTTQLSTIAITSQSTAAMENESQGFCTTCDLTFPTKLLRNQHMKTRSHQLAITDSIVAENPASALGIPLTLTSLKKLSCQLCQLEFESKALRDRHVKISRRHRQTFGCDICDQGFLDSDALSRHTVSSHTTSAVANEQGSLAALPEWQHSSQGISYTTSRAVQSVALSILCTLFAN
jgi:hypothetical protein